ncbi:MAG: O-methyltransferase [Ruminococcaceae bacterium]|nr:O-methyltransferase [Oscillospiraceae bacterium]
MDNYITYDFISEYLKNTVKKESPFLQELYAYARENHIPVIQSEAGRLLGFLVSLTNAKTILEVGTAIGYSAMLMYDASQKTAHITTIERDEEMFLNARINIKKYGAKQNIKTIFGDAEEELDKIEGPFDLIFIDAAKGQSGVFFEKCLSKIKNGGLIITDNVLYGGMIATDELAKRKHRTITNKMREFLTMLCSRDDLDTTIIPIGDGMALTRVKG